MTLIFIIVCQSINGKRLPSVIQCLFLTGSHWLSALVSLVIRDVDVENTPIERIPLIDMFETEMIASRPIPRATSTHLQYDRLPLEHLQNKGKIILIIRNPKDVAASFYHFLQKEYSVQYDGSWDYFLKLFVDGKGKKENDIVFNNQRFKSN